MIISLLNRFHTKLGMKKYDETWHETDMADELNEYQEAHGLIHLWSELSDVVYTYTRAIWSGHTTITFPFSKGKFYLGIIYMIPKYTLRWRFFKDLGNIISPGIDIREVRNPMKKEKLAAIAEKYNVDPAVFQAKASRLIRGRFFLK